MSMIIRATSVDGRDLVDVPEYVAYVNIAALDKTIETIFSRNRRYTLRESQ